MTILQNEIKDFFLSFELSTLGSKRVNMWILLMYLSLRFDRYTALELGAGLGLCSIVLGRVAKRVFCTGIVLDV